MNKFFKVVILISGLVIIFFLVMEAWRENLNMDWQKYQRKYKEELKLLAQTEAERTTASEYEVKLRQIVIPQLDRSDRCVTCHVGMEDNRMKDMPHPLKSHPGDYLDTHDINKVGCTSCHDGQGRAITADEAHARGADKFWEKPILKGAFLESTCVRCHVGGLEQTPTYNLGKQLFKQKGCFACHSIGDIGGAKGPALSDIGNASFHVKMPTYENRKTLLEKFEDNVNLAYLYEAVVDPEAQPEETLMKKVPMSEEETTALVVYLKSLSSKRRAMDVGAKESAGAGTTVVKALPAKVASGAKVTGASAKGYQVFKTSCVACHSVGEGDGVGPDLKGVVSKRDPAWLKRFIQYPTKMIEEKDPLAMELLAKYKTPMVDMGLTDEEVEEVIKYLKDPEAVTIAPGAEASQDSGAKGDPTKTATKAQISKGKALFQGTQAFLRGGPSCVACHTVRSSDMFGGGTLGKELSTSYSRLGAAGTKAMLSKPPFPLMKEAYRNKDLTSDEVTALTAFLEHVDAEQGNQQPSNASKKMLLLGLAGAIVIFGVLGLAGRNRKRKSVNHSIYARQKRS